MGEQGPGGARLQLGILKSNPTSSTAETLRRPPRPVHPSYERRPSRPGLSYVRAADESSSATVILESPVRIASAAKPPRMTPRHVFGCHGQHPGHNCVRHCLAFRDARLRTLCVIKLTTRPQVRLEFQIAPPWHPCQATSPPRQVRLQNCAEQVRPPLTGLQQFLHSRIGSEAPLTALPPRRRPQDRYSISADKGRSALGTSLQGTWRSFPQNDQSPCVRFSFIALRA